MKILGHQIPTLSISPRKAPSFSRPGIFFASIKAIGPCSEKQASIAPCTRIGILHHVGRKPQLLRESSIAIRRQSSVSSVRDLLTTISKMDYVVTCRLHGVIFVHLLNKPVLTIAHHPKVTELMAALGLSETAWRNFNTSELAGGKVHVDGEQRRGNQESDDRDLDVKQAVAEISI